MSDKVVPFELVRNVMVMTLKKCQNIYDVVYLLCSYFSSCKVRCTLSVKLNDFTV